RVEAAAAGAGTRPPLIASLSSVGVRETGFWHARQMLGRSDPSELAAARLRSRSEAALVLRGLQIVGQGARGDFCPARDTDGIEAQPKFGRARGLDQTAHLSAAVGECGPKRARMRASRQPG